MLYIVSLEMTESEYAACENRPQLFLLKAPFLQASLVDFILKGALGELEKRIDLKEGHTKLILRIAYDFGERTDMSTIVQLLLPVHKEEFLFEERIFVVAADLPEQIFLFSLFVLQISQSFVDVFLEDVELVD